MTGKLLLLLCAVILLSFSACDAGESGTTSPTLATLPHVAIVTTTAPQNTTTTAATTATVSQTSAATTTAPTAAATAPLGDVTVGGQIADTAREQMGKPFLYGAIGPNAFDNSGFVYYCFAQNGITVPRVTYEMYHEGGVAIREDELRPGDLVFYTMGEPGSAEYVGIYVGNREFIACSNEDRPVDVFGMDWAYFAEKYVGARRYS